jgi:hypothetical protein
LAVLSIFLGCQRLLSNSFTKYYTSCVQGDLADVAGHYNLHPVSSNTEELLSTGPSGFWIAEKEFPDGSGAEIVGYVGLGMG